MASGTGHGMASGMGTYKTGSRAESGFLKTSETTFRLTRIFQAGVFELVGAELCRTLALQDQNWTYLL